MHPPPALSVTCIKVQSGHILWAIPLGQKHWITHLISTNYTQTQSLIQAVDIEQPAVVNYFFTILSRKSSQASVGRRSVSSKSILPELWALTICFLKKKKNIHRVAILFSTWTLCHTVRLSMCWTNETSRLLDLEFQIEVNEIKMRLKHNFYIMTTFFCIHSLVLPFLWINFLSWFTIIIRYLVKNIWTQWSLSFIIIMNSSLFRHGIIAYQTLLQTF